MKIKKGKVIAAALSVLVLSGCAGQMAVTGKAVKFNMDAVDNRYARAGLNVVMAPVYAVTSGVDYAILNPIEFWTGTNILTDQPSIFDAKGENYIEINDQLDDSLTTAPIK
ncbi:DUF3332 domain-containing protein [Photobacterium sp. SDRW27]|uniref:DUF3332 family protein n=1 Tax=Photobacterium obscurum TaxID=2829490 RepID=UPI002244B0AD|nr:DUF3332 family protein [Photobacterium obscurum]MCW8330174.1 DUF3332 domain-containing protein [Photobacterium obscurum]